ncbi:UNVERIFIED_CONTAM: hypothetical protein HDU68_012467 [Siphonaria sp. JEL0065]|nr:hypothetical protein HDU68_012467 [Siphonaria sp. JEL0065]
MPAFDLHAFADPALNVKVAKNLSLKAAKSSESIRQSPPSINGSVAASTASKTSPAPQFFIPNLAALSTRHI